ncbi:hypothetical protein HO133_005019 [Letharia lupina]|uniref:Uncharacterized protein n=1 Tax=Letharia lupina TaxID=560253 RepID=A0A8H6C993_9LECA|nr:uncharacterized protein HO133_005019 [Letharia lupina]KAF6219194.1 hypothetical protein HO133_005019 [Letharia lupina]
MSSSAPQDKSSNTPDIGVGLPTKPMINLIIDPIPNPFRDQMPTTMMSRKAFSKAGKPAVIQVNSHIVEQWPTINIYQYDIVIGNGAEKRGLIQAVWASKKVKSEISQYGPGFIFDVSHLGWATSQKPDRSFVVDLDVEKGQTPRAPRDGQAARENKHRVAIKFAKKVQLATVRAYLEGTVDFDNGILEGINFLDHLLRETPSKSMINLRRSYFARHPVSEERTLLTGGVEAMKGVYQSIRLAEGKRLVVNVDVSNSCFWHPLPFNMLAFQLSGEKGPERFESTSHRQPDGRDTMYMPLFKRLCRNKFFVKHRGSDETKIWTVKQISRLNAKEHKFDVTEKATGKVTNMSVYEYFQKKYNIPLRQPWLPLVQTQKPNVLFPMEVCVMCDGQRYPFKLNSDQTANMIKFAVSRPPQRRQAIDQGLKKLDWAKDPMLLGYGMKINPTMLKTNARILEPPEPLFAKGATAKPNFTGRWDLRGKVFLQPNDRPLKSWGIVVLMPQDRRPPVTVDQIEAFKKNFLTLYRGHGGQVENMNPPIIGGVPDDAKAIETCFMRAGSAANLRPQMLMVILSNKSAEVYNRVKKSCDCRFGIMSQCVQASNVVKNQPQYCSNVLMKFNCKLGGTTSMIKAKKQYFEESTMIIGADVSHAAPGMVDMASMAAMTVSLDRTCSRYGAAVQSNGHRVEMITSSNIHEMLKPLVAWWMANVGNGHPPKHLYYFRDGVSEGQYTALLKQEVADIKQLMDEMGQRDPGNKPKMTVVVAEKRHHIRFFPPQGMAGDKNGNPVPGTLVERDVTHPWENDIYLCSHVAIQGTARPVHYHMLMDEANLPVEKFQTLLYEHCYQFQRATTPVSLFPAVYYAHLASNRATSHIDLAKSEISRINREKRAGKGIIKVSDGSDSEWAKLLPMEPTNGIGLGMWYI